MVDMDVKNIGVVELSALYEKHEARCRVIAFIWEGNTTPNDVVEIRSQGKHGKGLLWACRAEGSQTYRAFIIGRPGMHCPDGFYVAKLSRGRVLAYLAE